jgi:hypothetical protein
MKPIQQVPSGAKPEVSQEHWFCLFLIWLAGLLGALIPWKGPPK